MPAYETVEEMVSEDLLDLRDLADLYEEITADDYEIDGNAAQISELRAVLETLASEMGQGSNTVAETFRNFADECDPGLIRESYFETYAQELAEDLGAVPTNEHTWPNYCIDWQWAARELSHDYTTYEIAGVSYYTLAC